MLFLNVVFCCAIFLPLMVLSFAAPELTAGTIFHMPPLTLRQHALLLLKAAIVLSSWMTAYYALKHLPITIASPIKATQPILTLVGALVVFGERLNLYQWIGVAIAIVSFFMLSQSSKREGVNFAHNRWVWLMVCSIVMGTVSGLYDKWIMTHIDRMNTQVWYNYYQLLIMCVVLLAVWYPKRRQTTPFRWSWAIPLISVFLTAADFFYYFALADGASMIASCRWCGGRAWWCRSRWARSTSRSAICVPKPSICCSYCSVCCSSFWAADSDYLPDLRLLHSRQSIWQLSAMVRPPACHGVMWSASICVSSK